MPPASACRFTTSELAVLRIVGDEVRAHGVCGLHIDALAARAGCCRTTAQNAIREAKRLGLLTVEERRRCGQPSLTNLIRIVSREWLTWLRLRKTRVQKFEHHGHQEFKTRNGDPWGGAASGLSRVRNCKSRTMHDGR